MARRREEKIVERMHPRRLMEKRGKYIMMRIFFCPNCHTYRIVSDRLEAECIRCADNLYISDIPFEMFVDLNQDQRQEVCEKYLQEAEAKKIPVGRSRITRDISKKARLEMEKMLGKEVPSNYYDLLDTGYDY